MSDLMNEAATIMVTGMVTVFIFLVILIGAIKLLGFAFAGGASDQNAQGQSRQPARGAKQTTSAAKLAAIGAAVRRYRNS